MINILLSITSVDDVDIINTIRHYLINKKRVLILLYSFFQAHTPNEDKYNEYYSSSSEHHNKVVTAFKGFGMNEDSLIFIDYYKHTSSQIISYIKTSDVIYFPGGSPDEMMNRIHDKGLYEELSKFEGVVIGSSAGTMIQFDEFMIIPDDDYNKPCKYKGLGYIKNYYVEVHYSGSRLEKRYINKSSETKNFLMIPNNGMVVFEDNRIVKSINSSIKLKKEP